MHEVMIFLGYIYVVLILGGSIAVIFMMAYIMANEIIKNIKRRRK